VSVEELNYEGSSSNEQGAANQAVENVLKTEKVETNVTAIGFEGDKNWASGGENN